MLKKFWFLPVFFFIAACSGAIPSVEAEGDTSSLSVSIETMLPTQSTEKDTPMILPGTAKSKYLAHRSIIASVFWVGEEANKANDYIDNLSSAWVSDWVGAFGGVDTPNERNPDNQYLPLSFTPKENPFYLALPANEYDENGLLPGAREASPWSKEVVENGSLFKNRWVLVTRTLPDGHQATCFGQWEDVGPNNPNQHDYVFGEAEVDNQYGLGAGIDISPAVAICLQFEGDIANASAIVEWIFVDEEDVPYGPWSEIVTTSGPKW
jgi:hypothetical protein